MLQICSNYEDHFGITFNRKIVFLGEKSTVLQVSR